jgi:hypothetical protein
VRTSLWLMAPGLVKFMMPVSLRLACSKPQQETAQHTGNQCMKPVCTCACAKWTAESDTHSLVAASADC